MSSSKHLSSVALFPLCDARSVLMDALRDTSDAPATRGDALVFAWRLELPEGMNVGHAANAVLLTALSVPRTSWTRRQLLIIRELMVLAGREDPLPTDGPKKPIRQVLSESMRQRRSASAPTVNRAAAHTATKPAPSMRKLPVTAKEDKDWWRLVGRAESDATPARNSKRPERTSREP